MTEAANGVERPTFPPWIAPILSALGLGLGLVAGYSAQVTNLGVMQEKGADLARRITNMEATVMGAAGEYYGRFDTLQNRISAMERVVDVLQDRMKRMESDLDDIERDLGHEPPDRPPPGRN